MFEIIQLRFFFFCKHKTLETSGNKVIHHFNFIIAKNKK